MSQGSETNWLWPTCLLAGINAIVLIVFFVAMPTSEIDSGSKLDIGEEDSLVALTDAINRLAENSGARQASDVSPRRVSGVPNSNSPNDSGLSESIRQLTEAVTVMAQSFNARGASSAQEHVLKEVAAPKLAAANIQSMGALSKEEVRANHQLWTLKQLVSKYGNPAGMWISQSGNLQLQYEDKVNGTRFEFAFLDGMVVSTSVRKRN